MRVFFQFFSCTLFFLSITYSSTLQATTSPYTLSASKGALAPNAGGQDAYTLRLAHDDREIHAYLNRSLSVGKVPLMGAGYDLRFEICDDCFWKVFLQSGAGLSNAGPYIELDWGLAIPLLPVWLPMDPPRYVPQIRIDFSTHIIFGQVRPNVWSYPLWIGIAVPF